MKKQQFAYALLLALAFSSLGFAQRAVLFGANGATVTGGGGGAITKTGSMTMTTGNGPYGANTAAVTTSGATKLIAIHTAGYLNYSIQVITDSVGGSPSTGVLTLSAAGNASAGSTVYTYSSTVFASASNAYAGLLFAVNGFDNAVNNGYFTATASTTTTLTLSNAVGVSDTHAAIAVATANSWAQCGTTAQDSAGMYSQIWYTNPTVTGATHVVSSSVGGGGGYPDISGGYYADTAGTPTCGLTDSNASTTNVTSQVAGAAGITTSALSLLVSTASFNGMWSGATVTNGFGTPVGQNPLSGTQVGGYYSDLIQTSIGTPTNTTWGTGSVSSDVATLLVSFH